MASSKTSGAKSSTSGSKPAAAKPAGAKSTETSHRSSTTASKEAVRRPRRTPQQVTDSRIKELLDRPGALERMFEAVAKELLSRPDGDKTLLDFAAKEVLNRPNGGAILVRLALAHMKDAPDILNVVLRMLNDTPEGREHVLDLITESEWDVQLRIADKDSKLIRQVDEYAKLNSKTMDDQIEELRSLKQNVEKQAAVNKAEAARLDEYEQELDGRAEAKRQRDAEAAEAKRQRERQIEAALEKEVALGLDKISEDEARQALITCEEDREQAVKGYSTTPESNLFTERIQPLVSMIRFRRATS